MEVGQSLDPFGDADSEDDPELQLTEQEKRMIKLDPIEEDADRPAQDFDDLSDLFLEPNIFEDDEGNEIVLPSLFST